jgi:hypothetical protein
MFVFDDSASVARFTRVGHTHCPFEHRAGGVHLANPGAVSLSVSEDKGASYALQDVEEDEYSLQHYRVPYDRAKVIDQLNRMRHPGRRYLIKYLSDQ